MEYAKQITEKLPMALPITIKNPINNYNENMTPVAIDAPQTPKIINKGYFHQWGRFSILYIWYLIIIPIAIIYPKKLVMHVFLMTFNIMLVPAYVHIIYYYTSECTDYKVNKKLSYPIIFLYLFQIVLSSYYIHTYRILYDCKQINNTNYYTCTNDEQCLNNLKDYNNIINDFNNHYKFTCENYDELKREMTCFTIKSKYNINYNCDNISQTCLTKMKKNKDSLFGTEFICG